MTDSCSTVTCAPACMFLWVFGHCYFWLFKKRLVQCALWQKFIAWFELQLTKQHDINILCTITDCRNHSLWRISIILYRTFKVCSPQPVEALQKTWRICENIKLSSIGLFFQKAHLWSQSSVWNQFKKVQWGSCNQNGSHCILTDNHIL